MSSPREHAEQTARERRVDQTVRRVVKSGRPDEARINYDQVLMLKDGARLEVRATFGAGVNGSRVWHSTHGLVYEAYDYGRHLVVLRTGPWLDELEGLASELEHEHNAEDAHRQAQARAEEDERFRPLD